MDAEAVLRKEQETLLKLPHVAGVGLSEDKGTPIIVVFMPEAAPEGARNAIPKQLQGIPVQVKPPLVIGPSG